MKNELWQMFELTGNIDMYLYYKSKVEERNLEDDEQYGNQTLS